jgi:protocatechuate 3,4-dioxygenase beta subunit
MKNLIALICLVCFFSTTNSIFSQDSNTQTNNQLHDRAEELLSNTDTIPDFRSKTNKLKLTGIVYQSDGVTPAKDVIIYIEHADEDGNFDLRRTGEERYVFHRSWVKTDADGRYTFHTFVPGNDRRYSQLQQIFPLVKAPSKKTYELQSFVFDADPLLTKRCRKRLAKKGQTNRILTTTEKDGLLIANKNIILSEDTEPTR